MIEKMTPPKKRVKRKEKGKGKTGREKSEKRKIVRKREMIVRDFCVGRKKYIYTRRRKKGRK